MDFRILGPLEVSTDDGPITLGGPKQRAVLAHLLLRTNGVVPADVLIDALWGDEPPDTARNTLQTYVHRLRKVLGDERIEGRGRGYMLTTVPEEIDAARFELLVKRGKDSIASDPVAAATTLLDALSLWRGNALADLAEEASLRGEITRLEDMRLSATEYLMSAELAAGRHSTVVGRLEALTAQHPMRERLWANLMLALYRSGRQGEALAAYQEARSVLADELGIDPSAELQRLNQQILEQDPVLATPEAPRKRADERTVHGDLPAESEFAGYRIERVLGRGGMSVVYLAEHLGLRRKVALKLLAPQLAEDPHFRERFTRESQIAASIDHPNLIAIYEAGEAERQLFIAMRYVDGTDLRTLLHEQGRLEEAHTVRIIRQVADALDTAHARGLVHRDVKPGNVLLARAEGQTNDHAFLSDFGLTKRAASQSGVTGTGQFVGTLDYAAPEQFQGSALTPRTDIYSLGCVLYECLTGHPPFLRDSDAAVMYAHLMEAPPRLTDERPDLPSVLDGVVSRAMAKNPDDRYPSAGSVVAEVATAIGYIHDLGATVRPSPGRQAQRSRGLIVGLALLLVVASTLLIVNRGDGGDSFPTGPNTVAVIDATTGEIIDGVALGAGALPGALASGLGSVWVANFGAETFAEIDPDTRSVTAASSARGLPSAIAAGEGFVWIATGLSDAVQVFDPAAGRIVESVPVPNATDLAVGFGWVWATDSSGGSLYRIDPDSLEAMRFWIGEPRRDEKPTGVAAGEGGIWVANLLIHTVTHLNPQTGEVVTPNIAVDPCAPEQVAVGAGYVWATCPHENLIVKIDPRRDTLVDTFEVATGPTGIVAAADAVWVTCGIAGTVQQIDALSGEVVSSTSVDGIPYGPIVVAGELWAAVSDTE